MAGKLDQSLDEIVSSQRRSTRRPRSRRVGGSSRTSAAPPVGGVKKSTQPARGAIKGKIPTGPAATSGDSKVIVSNLPSDVNETQIKDYFSKTIGPVKKCMITYGPNGVSRGVATIIFSKPDAASIAATNLNGVNVDNRPMKVEVVVDASRAPPPPPVKSLGDRIAQPKAQPRSAAVTKNSADSGRNGRGGRPRVRRGRNAGRGKPKTADELDAEMADYFEAEPTTNGAANGVSNAGGQMNGGVVQDPTQGQQVQAAPTNGAVDDGMDDGIL